MESRTPVYVDFLPSGFHVLRSRCLDIAATYVDNHHLNANNRIRLPNMLVGPDRLSIKVFWKCTEDRGKETVGQSDYLPLSEVVTTPLIHGKIASRASQSVIDSPTKQRHSVMYTLQNLNCYALSMYQRLDKARIWQALTHV